MKRIFALILIAALAFAMVACGSTEPIAKDVTDESVDTAAVRELFDKAVAYIDPIIKTEGLTSSMQDDDDGKHLYNSWGYDKDLGNDEFSLDVNVDDKTITIGTTKVSELKDMGFKAELGAETVEPDSATSVYIMKGNKTLNFGTESNNTDADLKTEDMTLGVLYGSTDEYSIPFTYMGLNADSTLQDIIDTLGVTKYRVSLAVDSYGATIEVNYYKEISKTEVTQTMANLMISLLYDGDNNTSSIGSIQLNYDVNEYITEETEE